jgi:hypothetical protein
VCILGFFKETKSSIAKEKEIPGMTVMLRTWRKDANKTNNDRRFHRNAPQSDVENKRVFVVAFFESLSKKPSISGTGIGPTTYRRLEFQLEDESFRLTVIGCEYILLQLVEVSVVSCGSQRSELAM